MIRRADFDSERFLNKKYHGRKVWLEGDTIVIRIPMNFKKHGGRKEIILPEGANPAEPPKRQPQRPLVVALAKAYKWQNMLETGEVSSIKELARQNKVDPSYIARILRLATLAPDIVEAILDGREPSGLSLRKLTGNLALLWREQQEMLACSANQ